MAMQPQGDYAEHFREVVEELKKSVEQVANETKGVLGPR
jgi:hypothetical protein